MSELIHQNEEFMFCEFCGRNGNSMQITSKNDAGDFIQVDTEQAVLVINQLVEFLQRDAKRKKERIKKQIKDLKIKEKTIANDLIDCEKFYSQIEPLKFLSKTLFK